MRCARWAASSAVALVHEDRRDELRVYRVHASGPPTLASAASLEHAGDVLAVAPTPSAAAVVGLSLAAELLVFGARPVAVGVPSLPHHGGAESRMELALCDQVSLTSLLPDHACLSAEWDVQVADEALVPDHGESVRRITLLLTAPLRAVAVLSVLCGQRTTVERVRVLWVTPPSAAPAMACLAPPDAIVYAALSGAMELVTPATWRAARLASSASPAAPSCAPLVHQLFGWAPRLIAAHDGAPDASFVPVVELQDLGHAWLALWLTAADGADGSAPEPPPLLCSPALAVDLLTHAMLIQRKGRSAEMDRLKAFVQRAAGPAGAGFVRAVRKADLDDWAMLLSPPIDVARLALALLHDQPYAAAAAASMLGAHPADSTASTAGACDLGSSIAQVLRCLLDRCARTGRLLEFADLLSFLRTIAAETGEAAAPATQAELSHGQSAMLWESAALSSAAAASLASAGSSGRKALHAALLRVLPPSVVVQVEIASSGDAYGIVELDHFVWPAQPTRR